ncbi:MAG: hypothetical protein A2089_11320 [Elusimicrobia bacterium GWD2_63_28]|nr:MAG: hypothetical protein A2089_11320 [Elusimicrobia bacterium GWD2_63_28]
MPITVSIHQSQYIPWFPYFKKIALADIFVVMDSVQYQKNGVQNRNKVRNYDGDFWLTIPVTGKLEDQIREKRIADASWRAKHWKSLKSSYSKAPYWAPHEAELGALYAADYATLYEANNALFSFMLKAFGIGTKIVPLSDLKAGGAKSELVLNICRELGAETYVSGTGGKAYLDEASFAAARIAIRYESAASPAYAQFHGAFIPDLSALDMLFNVPQEEIRSVLAGT